MSTSSRWYEDKALRALLGRPVSALPFQAWSRPIARQILEARYLGRERAGHDDAEDSGHGGGSSRGEGSGQRGGSSRGEGSGQRRGSSRGEDSGHGGGGSRGEDSGQRRGSSRGEGSRRGGGLETVETLITRVAGAVAQAEGALRAQAEERFAALLRSGAFLPNSPTLMNAGQGSGQLAACFVLPVPDSIPEIFEAVRDMALVQKTGGGTGFSFSRLRPADDQVASTGGHSAGPLPFLQVFDAATESIRQGGRRRGANMGVLDVDHPDILRFITSKADPDRLRNFNLSVAVTDVFWSAAEAGEPYPLVNARTGQAVRRLDARRVLRLMARCAWLSGEPGLLFVDAINRANPTPQLGRIASTNPCGELPLLDWESCNLGSLNLAWFLRDPATRAGADGSVAGTSHAEATPSPARARAAIDLDVLCAAVDLDALRAAVWWAVRFLDDVIDTTAFPLLAVAEATLATRKIGLGVMGFADLLVGLGIPYDAPEALAVADQVMGFVATESRRASEALAQERGPFPAFAGSPEAARGATPRRNATTNSIAPTGTISLLAGCSAGIEPIYSPVHYRRMLDGARVRQVHPLFAARLAGRGALDDALLDRVAAAGTARVQGVPADLAALFVSAHEVAPEHHVAVQAAFQRHVDSSVSKTVNLPAHATPEQVLALFEQAHDSGCKGITVYRDGSRPGQVLEAGAGLARPRAPERAPRDPHTTGDAEAHAEGSARDEDDSDARTKGDPGACPECGATLERAGPLSVCYACAWSALKPTRST